MKPAFRAAICTLFPEYFDGPLACSIIGRAIEEGRAEVSRIDIRSFATSKHRVVDDTPYGGGAGMVMRAPELAAATRYARRTAPSGPVVYLTPQGAPFTQARARALAASGGMVVVCGRYEGVDERFIERCVDLELSLGDFVLTGGEPAAVAVLDAVIRLVPGVLGNEASSDDESFSRPLLEYPQFTRPARFEGLEVPEVLRSGDHGRVEAWRDRLALARTAARRPDLGDGDAVAEVVEAEEWMVRPRHGETGER